MTRDEINRMLAARGVRNADLADLLDISADKVSKSRNPKGTRQWQAGEFAKIKDWLERGHVAPRADHAVNGGGKQGATDLPSAADFARILDHVAPILSGGPVSEDDLLVLGEIVREVIADRMREPSRSIDWMLGGLARSLRDRGIDRASPQA